MALLDARPPALDLMFKPDTTVVFTLTWPADTLAGRVFSSTLDGDPLTLVIDGDVMTITVSDEITAAFSNGATIPWVLYETILGEPEAILQGTWTASNKPATNPSYTVNVLDGDLEVTISLVGGGAALAAHTAQVTGSGVHGRIDHRWSDSGWTPFDPVVMNAHGSQVFVPSVANGRGVVTGTAAGNGSHRVAYLHEDTDWDDAEVTSMIHGPTGWDGTNAQQGHLHRVREITPGVWEGIAIWTSVVFGAGYEFLHVNSVRFDGTQILFGGGPAGFGATDLRYFDRQTRVLAHQRFNFVSWINQYVLHRPELLQHLITGDPITTEGLTDTTFNETAVSILGAVDNNGHLQVIDPTHTTPVSYVVDSAGLIKPAGAAAQKRYVPYGLATRIVGGSASSVQVEAKRWRIEDGKPDWGDSRVMRGSVTTSVDVPTVPVGPGRHGLWAAHFHDGSAGAWGDISIRKL